MLKRRLGVFVSWYFKQRVYIKDKENSMINSFLQRSNVLLKYIDRALRQKKFKSSMVHKKARNRSRSCLYNHDTK